MQSFSRVFTIITRVACLAACVHCHSEPQALAADGGDTGQHKDAQPDPQQQAGAAAQPKLDASLLQDASPDGTASAMDASLEHGNDAATDAASPQDSAQPDAMQPALVGSSMIVGVGSWGLRERSADGGPFVTCRNPSTGNDHSPDLLRDVSYAGGVFIAVGGDMNAMVMRSLDAVHWQEDLHSKTGCTSACNDWMGAVAYQDGTWLAAGGNGAVMRSTDGGLNWTGVKPKPTPTAVRHMAAGSGRFVAGGDKGAVFVSADKGDNWTRFDLWTNHASAEGMRIAHGAGSFIAWGSWYNSGTSKTEQSCFVSVDKGDHWQPCDASVANSASFVHDGTRWITRAGSGYAASSDGLTWTMHTASNVPSELLFDGKTWFGRTGSTLARGESPDTFKVVAGTKATDYRSWTVGIVLDSNLPVMGVPACTNTP
jgi:hypothetical protein